MIIDKENNERANIHRKKKSVFKSLLLHLNYILGYTFGVNHKGIFKEIKILNNLISYCEQKNITLFIVGPASRPRSRIENSLLYKLEKKLSKYHEQNHYISCYGTINQAGESIFMEDKVHLNAKGHAMISELILNKFKKVMVKN